MIKQWIPAPVTTIFILLGVVVVLLGVFSFSVSVEYVEVLGCHFVAVAIKNMSLAIFILLMNFCLCRAYEVCLCRFCFYFFLRLRF